MDLLGLANYAVFMGILIGIYALLALGLNIQWGFTGLFNAGHRGLSSRSAPTPRQSSPACRRAAGWVAMNCHWWWAGWRRWLPRR